MYIATWTHLNLFSSTTLAICGNVDVGPQRWLFKLDQSFGLWASEDSQSHGSHQHRTTAELVSRGLVDEGQWWSMFEGAPKLSKTDWLIHVIYNSMIQSIGMCCKLSPKFCRFIRPSSLLQAEDGHDHEMDVPWRGWKKGINLDFLTEIMLGHLCFEKFVAVAIVERISWSWDSSPRILWICPRWLKLPWIAVKWQLAIPLELVGTRRAGGEKQHVVRGRGGTMGPMEVDEIGRCQSVIIPWFGFLPACPAVPKAELQAGDLLPSWLAPLLLGLAGAARIANQGWNLHQRSGSIPSEVSENKILTG